MKLRIGSRGSPLAMWQANHIQKLLVSQGHSVEIETIVTTGDKKQSVSFAEVGTKGIFTKEIEDALMEGRVDLAVHSLKDLPTELPAGFALAATPHRADPRDVLVSVKFADLASLPQGAVVGTSSKRRQAQLKALRPDVQVVEFRGNVDTRLRKLIEGQVDAIMLAAAGVDRLEKTEWVRQRMEPKDFCPAAGQGSLGIETREGDATTMEALKFLDDPGTRYAVTTERAALAALGGGCQVPIGIHCRMLGQDHAAVEVFGVVADPDTGQTIRIHELADSAETDPESLGKLVARKLIEAGAGSLIQLTAETGVSAETSAEAAT